MILYIYFLLGYFDDASFFFFRLLIDTLLVEGLSMFPLKMCLRMVDSLSLSCRRVLTFPSYVFILRCHNMVVVLGSWSSEIGFLN